MNKLFEEFGTRAIAEFNVELRFQARAGRGDAAEGSSIADKLTAELDKAAPR